MTRFAFAAVFLVLATPAPSSAQAADPAALFAAEHRAAGGAAWDRIAEIVERGTLRSQGLTGSYTGYVDTQSGRSHFSVTLGAMVQGHGYDAHGPWTYDDGLLDVLGDAASVADARSNAYVARNGWWNRIDPAVMTYAGARTDGGKRYDVVRVVPRGGTPMEVWLDATSHLIAKIAMRNASNVTTTTTYSAYRRVAGIVYPFATDTGNGNPAADSHQRATSIAALTQLHAADFQRPNSVRLGSIQGGTSTTVPFDLDNASKGHIVVLASINGSRPLHVIFDTGGSAIVTPEVAREIGLRGKGALAAGGAGEQQLSVQIATGATLKLGAMTLRNQQVGIFPLPTSLVHVTGKYAIDGVIGYEVLKNFVVAIDYVGKRMTLTEPRAFRSDGLGTPIHFASATIPVIRARFDGVDGDFMIDTGNAFYNTVSKTFLDRNRPELPTSNVLVQSSGNIGGAIRSPLLRVPSLAIGPYSVERPIFAVTQTAKGALAGTAFAGNLGEAILSRFDLAFDYGKNTIYFKPNPNFNLPFAGSYDGMSLFKPSAGELQVAYVNSGSPAARAGISDGDGIVSVDGIPASQLGPADVLTMEAGKASVRIVFTHAGTSVEKELQLSEQVP